MAGRAVAYGPALLCVLLGACGGSSGGDAANSGLSVDEACDQFDAIVQDFSLTDEESADQFHALSSDTADPELAAAIGEVGDLFARHADEIPSGPVTQLCP